MPSPPAADRPTLLIVLAIASVACILRAGQLGESLWVDELHTAWVARGHAGELLGRAAAGNQAPLYHALQWILVRAAGPNEIVLRSSSLLAGTLLVAVTFWIARDITGGIFAALVAAGLAAVDRQLVFYAQEARPYAWVQLLAAVQVWAWLRAMREPTPARWLAVAWLAIALFYTHYAAALLLAPLVIDGLVRLPPDRRHRRWLLGTLVGTVAAGLPAIPHVLDIAGRRYQWSPIVASHPPVAVATAAAVYVALPLAAAAIGAVALSRFRRGSTASAGAANPPTASGLRDSLWLVGLWLAVPTAVAAASTYAGVAPLFMTRYLQIVWPAFPIFVAIVIRLSPVPALRSAIALVVLTASIATGGMVSQFVADGRILDDRRENWREALAWVSAGSHERQAVVVFPGLVEDRALAGPHPRELAVYCRFPIDSLYPAAPRAPVRVALASTLPVRLEPAVRAELERADGVVVVVRGGERTSTALAGALAQELARDGRPRKLERRAFGPGLSVIRIRPRRAD